MERKKIQKVILEKKPRLIGVCGTGNSVGCTHFAIMMANYLAGCLRKKIVVLEWNRSGDFGCLEKICTGRSRTEKSFWLLDVQYYKNAGRAELTEVIRNNVDAILIDFGTVDGEHQADILLCEELFVVGSFSEWQEDHFREFVHKHGSGNTGWKYLAAFGSEETRKEFMRRPGIAVERIPFAADAFSVTKECYLFFRRLIEM